MRCTQSMNVAFAPRSLELSPLNLLCVLYVYVNISGDISLAPSWYKRNIQVPKQWAADLKTKHRIFILHVQTIKLKQTVLTAKHSTVCLRACYRKQAAFAQRSLRIFSQPKPLEECQKSSVKIVYTQMFRNWASIFQVCPLIVCQLFRKVKLPDLYV